MIQIPTNDIESINSPKGYIKGYFRDYKETENGKVWLSKINPETVSNKCPHFKEFYDYAISLPVEQHSEEN